MLPGASRGPPARPPDLALGFGQKTVPNVLPGASRGLPGVEASRCLLGHPKACRRPPGASWGLLVLPGAPRGILEASRGLLEQPGASRGPPGASWGLLGLPGPRRASWGPPGASWGIPGLPGGLLGLPRASWGFPPPPSALPRRPGSTRHILPKPARFAAPLGLTSPKYLFKNRGHSEIRKCVCKFRKRMQSLLSRFAMAANPQNSCGGRTDLHRDLAGGGRTRPQEAEAGRRRPKRG